MDRGSAAREGEYEGERGSGALGEQCTAGPALVGAGGSVHERSPGGVFFLAVTSFPRVAVHWIPLEGENHLPLRY